MLTKEDWVQKKYWTKYSVSEILADYKTACLSRELSLLMRKEVLTGKAKFGIGGAGKEIPLVAIAKSFRKGDYWNGYYRDQTFLLSKGLLDPVQYFSALYGDSKNDKFSAGRQMGNHYATELLGENGEWLDQRNKYNVLSALSPLGGHIPRSLGVALASKLYSKNEYLNGETKFSKSGKEVSFCILGDATTSEGIFFETLNAAGVLQVPLAFVILDDGYGISVPSKYQTTKSDISSVLEGFRVEENKDGIDIYKVHAWNYPQLLEVFELGIRKIRSLNRPALFHIVECTQPQGHSTSGSHERYKSAERLEWESERDGIKRMRQWMINEQIATKEDLDAIEKRAREEAIQGRNKAWKIYAEPVKTLQSQLSIIITDLFQQNKHLDELEEYLQELKELFQAETFNILAIAEKAKMTCIANQIQHRELNSFIHVLRNDLKDQYNSHLLSSGTKSALSVKIIPAKYESGAKAINGFEVLNAYFDKLFKKDPRVYAFGEDVGKIGDVNQAFKDLQKKYGEERIFDTGIREWSIVGQAIGMSMRGLKPIAEIQYLDYLAYAFPALTDDLASLHYRTKGLQAAPAIIRTRGHRLEGIWHAGSPMGMLIHSMRGIHILTPRNMNQAVGMYNTMLQSNDPAIIIECLNGYRLKEVPPSNLLEFTVPLGVPEILKEGSDLTIVSYGSTLKIAQNACDLLEKMEISVELIDVQTLLPFDLEHRILESIKKTNRLLIVDEDVPGGASAYILQQIMEVQKAFYYMDTPPATLTAKAHRPAYGNNGDYMSKPNEEDIVRKAFFIINEHLN